jgi:hypothetical protein
VTNRASSIEIFLQRWSRRKRAGARDNAHEAGKPHDEGGATAPQGPPPTLNPESLPPVEAIGAATDVRAFLKVGVPADLTRAALRRAWTADPAIRDFIGIADNQWDFTKPDGVPGFGPLRLTPELERLIGELFGDFHTALSQARADTGQKSSDPIDTKDAKQQDKIDEPGTATQTTGRFV